MMLRRFLVDEDGRFDIPPGWTVIGMETEQESEMVNVEFTRSTGGVEMIPIRNNRDVRYVWAWGPEPVDEIPPGNSFLDFRPRETE